MWQLGRVFEQPEAERMHFGSFHNKACNEDTAGKDACAMFARSKERLLDKLETLPLETPMIRMGGFGHLLAAGSPIARMLIRLVGRWSVRRHWKRISLVP